MTRRGLGLPDALILVAAAALFVALTVSVSAAARERSQLAAMRAELRQFAVAQESYFYDHRVYAADPLELASAGFRATPGTRITVNEATLVGWSATATRPETPASCFLFARQAAPVGAAVIPGEVRCS